jgi:cob(I)alamin adenosyltransferase
MVAQPAAAAGRPGLHWRMKLYTKTGDDGTTGLYGGSRTRKDDARVEAYGSVDELNAVLGVARSFVDDVEIDKLLAAVQHALFDVGADLATPGDAPQRAHLSLIDEADVAVLEAAIDRFDGELEPLRQFVLPGGHVSSATVHHARAVARRAERAAVRLSNEASDVNAAVIVYLNRLSDLLFVLARLLNAHHGVSESRLLVQRRQRA